MKRISPGSSFKCFPSSFLQSGDRLINLHTKLKIRAVAKALSRTTECLLCTTRPRLVCSSRSKRVSKVKSGILQLLSFRNFQIIVTVTSTGSSNPLIGALASVQHRLEIVYRRWCIGRRLFYLPLPFSASISNITCIGADISRDNVCVSAGCADLQCICDRSIVCRPVLRCDRARRCGDSLAGPIPGAEN